MHLLLFIVVMIHGLIHLLGFVKAFNLAPVGQLTQNISKTGGTLWLVRGGAVCGGRSAVLL